MTNRATPRLTVATVGEAGRHPCEAVVVEDDTQLVLGSKPLAEEEYVAPAALLQSALAATPRPTGSVVVEETIPLRFRVIVHDLNLEPTWREEWVSQGLASLLHEAGMRGVGSLALPVLGARHGELDSLRFCELLTTELREARVESLVRLCLIVPGNAEDARARLEELGFDVER